MIPLWDNVYAEGWSALLIGIPLFCAARQDLREMMIDDWIHFALLGMFAVWAVLFCTPEEIGYRVMFGFIMLGYGLLMAILGQMGGGDMKLGAAAAPFVDPETVGAALLVYLLVLVLTVPIRFFIRRAVQARPEPPQWKSMRPEIAMVPAGVSIAATAFLYRVLIVPF